LPSLRRRPRGALALLAVLALLATACGSRLSDDERTSRLQRVTASGAGQQTDTGAGPDTSGPAATAGPATDAGPSGPSGPSGPAGDNADDDPDGGPSGPAGAACANATKATDTGVTPSKVTVATLADISGVQPGLFQSAHQAARAASAYINSTGGICGRQIEPLLLDSKTDSGGNRAAMLDACEKAFAVAGSMSAFDDGSAAPGEACGIPDMTAITTNAAKYRTKNTFPISPNGSGYVSTSAPLYIKKTHPQAVKKGAMLWLNQAVTRNNANERAKAYEKVGFTFVYKAEVQVLEANYTRFVQEMRSRGVQYVDMVSDFQSNVRLQKSFRQQNYVPEVRDWDSVAYDPDYLKEGDVVEGSLIFINTTMFEESGSNPEMKLYLDWLQKASPGAVPDFFGIYTWSAYRLFQKLATQIGPDLTREKLLAALKATSEWGANGMHAPHRIGAKRLSTCNIYIEVKGAKFVRRHPASGFDCTGSVVSVN
jgi:ABC-type branched-subunit amino acid transport system substrate-binding protein